MIGTSEGTGTGAMLASARRARGLDLADIARDTRVPLRHLRAIEEDNHDSLPALTYALGFVKSYARAVGVDPDGAAEQFRREFRGAPQVAAPAFQVPDAERRAPSPLVVGGSVAVVVAVIAGLSAWSTGLFDPPTPPPQVADVAPIEAPAEAPLTPAATPGTAPAPADTMAPASGPVVLTAREEVWVKIADPAQGQSFKLGTLAAGESLTIPTDQAGLKLWTGKAGALAVSIGGRELPPLGGPVERLRGQSLAAADLIARTTPAAAATDSPGLSPDAPTAAPASPAPVTAATTPAPSGPTGPKPIASVPRPRPPALPEEAPPGATNTTPSVSGTN